MRSDELQKLSLFLSEAKTRKKNLLRNVEVIVCFRHHESTMPPNTPTLQHSCNLATCWSQKSHTSSVHSCLHAGSSSFLFYHYFWKILLNLLETWVHKSYFRLTFKCKPQNVVKCEPVIKYLWSMEVNLWVVQSLSEKWSHLIYYYLINGLNWRIKPIKMKIKRSGSCVRQIRERQSNDQWSLWFVVPHNSLSWTKIWSRQSFVMVKVPYKQFSVLNIKYSFIHSEHFHRFLLKFCTIHKVVAE